MNVKQRLEEAEKKIEALEAFARKMQERIAREDQAPRGPVITQPDQTGEIWLPRKPA